MFTRYKAHIILVLSAATLFTGCAKLIEIDPPLNEISSEVVYKSDKTAQSALSGLYGLLSQSQTQLWRITVNTSLSADDLRYGVTGGFYDEYYNNTLDPLLSPSVGEMWNDLYSSIYRANSIIEGLEKYTGTSAAVNKQLKAEAKFLRAYCYFYLVNLFGEVPLITTTDVTVTALQPRAPAADVYDLIVKDLTTAKTDLREDYSVSGGNRHNANKYAAAALLARVYLYTGQYAAAVQHATDVINKTDLYGLIPSASMGTGVFVKNSREAIFQFMPSHSPTNSSTYEGSVFVSTTAQWDIRASLLNVFEPGDLRRSNWIKDTTFSGEAFHQPFKYKYRTNALAVAAGVVEYPTILRLAEQYLIRAEGLAQQNNLDDAAGDLNEIRVRAGLSPIFPADKSAMLTAIESERQKELFCELGHRWFDLKRTNRATTVLGALKPTWVPDAVWYPIPQTARDANPNLTQNKGYRQ